MGAGVSSLAASPNQRYLVVLTDGADCASRSFNRGSVEQLLRRSLGSGNFHSSLITVGNSDSPYVADLAKLATTHESLHHYNAVDAGQIESTFGTVTEEIHQIIKMCLSISISPAGRRP